MLKIYTVCLATLLLLSVSPFVSAATIGQVEQFNLIGENAAVLTGGPGSAIGGNMATICQGQSVVECCILSGIQSENSMLSQSADAAGKCGILSVLQEAAIGGAQEQLASTCGPKAQGQMLNVGLGQVASMVNADGGAGGGQGAVTDQQQTVFGDGIMNESQFVGATQYADVSGKCGADAVATNLIGVTAQQTQMAAN
ncbi:MAG: hypothetical protein JW715_16505 [Sedimentisphaerales bacterium]|nr:hypothetical protein [Sedimentisphaerales bacterium]